MSPILFESALVDYTGVQATVNGYVDGVLRTSFTGIIGTDLPNPTTSRRIGFDVVTSSSDSHGLQFDNIDVPVIGFTETFSGTPGTEISAYNSDWWLDPASIGIGGVEGIITSAGRARHNDAGTSNDGVWYRYQPTIPAAFFSFEADFYMGSVAGGTQKGGIMLWYDIFSTEYVRFRHRKDQNIWQLIVQVGGSGAVEDSWGETFNVGETRRVRLEAVRG